MFKVGDEVIKYKPYNSRRYCAFNGEEAGVPLGTEGIIRTVEQYYGAECLVPAGTTFYQVGFNNGVVWSVDGSEIKLKRSNTMLDSIKKFYEKHQDIFFTIGLVLLVDYFLFNGALRTRVQTLVEKLLGTIEKKFDGSADTKE